MGYIASTTDKDKYYKCSDKMFPFSPHKLGSETRQ